MVLLSETLDSINKLFCQAFASPKSSNAKTQNTAYKSVIKYMLLLSDEARFLKYFITY